MVFPGGARHGGGACNPGETMLGTFAVGLGAGALGLGLAGAGLRLWPRPGWGSPRLAGLGLRLYALQLAVWSLAHRGDRVAMARDRRANDARARGLLRRLRHPGVADLDEVQALACAYWLIVAGLGAALLLAGGIRALFAG